MDFKTIEYTKRVKVNGVWKDRLVRRLCVKVTKTAGLWRVVLSIFRLYSKVFQGASDTTFYALVNPIQIRVESFTEYIPVELYAHETVHVWQVDRLGRFKFILLYLWELRKGYTNNKFEVEARKESKDWRRILGVGENESVG